VFGLVAFCSSFVRDRHETEKAADAVLLDSKELRLEELLVKLEMLYRKNNSLKASNASQET
jgi:hypothetical protein